jgi:hypothetical protein
MPFVPIDFPREVLELPANGMKGWRRIVRNADELQQYWKGKNGSGNVYFTAYGYSETKAPKHHRVDYNTPLIHHFVMDFDCKDFKNRGAEVHFEVPQEEVRRLHQYLQGKNIEHFVWFSGGGFHVWVPFAESINPTSGSELSRVKYSGTILLNQWEKDIGGLRCNDPTVAFDTSGMIRIPNSYNARRDCWSIPLSSEDLMTLSYDDLQDKAMDAHEGYISMGGEPLEFKIVENQLMTMNDIKPVDLPTISYDDIHILPCLAQAAMGGGNPTDRARYHFVSYLADRFRMFFPAWKVKEEDRMKHVEPIVSICSQQNWVDFDRDYTTMRVSHIVKAGHTHATCASLYNEGLCVGKCNYYDGTGGL